MILDARVIVGSPMIDRGEADDKIVAVLANDTYWKDMQDIADFPGVVVERLRHYFATYKLIPGSPPQSSVEGSYGKDHALQVIRAAMEDYVEAFGG